MPVRYRQILAKALFLYGFLASAALLYLHVAINYFNRSELSDWFEADTEWTHRLLVMHAATFVVTFARLSGSESNPTFAPLIRPSERAVRIGRGILLASVLNIVVPIGIFRITRRDPGLTSAVLLLSATYTAVHWALRPENIFSWRVLRVLREGLYPYLLDWWMMPLIRKSQARKRAIPLDEWLSGLLRACESAVNSRLATSASPGAGEIDCIDFQDLVLDELESEACLIHYRKRLSAEGFREIQRFVRAVESLPPPDSLTWEPVVDSASSVLAVRRHLLAPRRTGRD